MLSRKAIETYRTAPIFAVSLFDFRWYSVFYPLKGRAKLLIVKAIFIPHSRNRPGGSWCFTSFPKQSVYMDRVGKAPATAFDACDHSVCRQILVQYHSCKQDFQSVNLVKWLKLGTALDGEKSENHVFTMWLVFPRLRGGWENVPPFIPRRVFLSLRTLILLIFFNARISPQWLSQLRRLRPDVSRQVARKLVSE